MEYECNMVTGWLTVVGVIPFVWESADSLMSFNRDELPMENSNLRRNLEYQCFRTLIETQLLALSNASMK